MAEPKYDVINILLAKIEEILNSIYYTIHPSQDSAYSDIQYIISSFNGIVPEFYNKGIIFGLNICRFSEIPNYFYYPSYLNYAENVVFTTLSGANVNKDDLVVTRGNIFDGNKVVNIGIGKENLYVYKIYYPSYNHRLSNCYVLGCVVYDVATSNFYTVLYGSHNEFNIQRTQTSVPVAIDKDSYKLQEVIDMFKNCKIYKKIGFTIPESCIRIGYVLFDITNIDNSENDYEVYKIIDDRQMYPLYLGLPSLNNVNLADRILEIINNIATLYSIEERQVVLLFNMLYNLNIWGDDNFYTYCQNNQVPDIIKYYIEYLGI